MNDIPPPHSHGQIAARAPLSLLVVAALFVLGGLLSGLNILATPNQLRIRIGLGVLGVFIGIGIARYNSIWRKVALIA